MPVAFEAFDDDQSESEPSLSDLFADAIEIIELDGIKITDLAHLEELIYHYKDGREFSVLHPLQRSIGLDGSHQITCADRVGIEVPVVGLLKIEHFPRFDEACFPGHMPVNEIERADD